MAQKLLGKKAGNPAQSKGKSRAVSASGKSKTKPLPKSKVTKKSAVNAAQRELARKLTAQINKKNEAQMAARAGRVGGASKLTVLRGMAEEALKREARGAKDTKIKRK